MVQQPASTQLTPMQTHEAEDVPVSEALISAAADSSDWSSLTTLDLNGKHITRAEGVERCPGLRVLDLSFNKLAQFRECTALTQLRDLKIHDNRVEDLQSVRRLSSLQVRQEASPCTGTRSAH